jgi:Membrane-bound lysozyme-inhibitor of c-type lysozyme
VFGALLLLSSSCASAKLSGGAAHDFRCRDGSELTVHYHQQTATVLVGGHSYALWRKPSNIGERFSSSRATLIIDGDFAAFVADDLHQLRGCRSQPTF